MLLDPRDVISSVVGEIGHRQVTVLSERSDRVARVAIKPNALRSALTHLITNALEASNKGDTVTVRSRVNGERVIIEVEDQGAGMDADFIREELFRPFHSTKATGHGIGAFQTRETIRGAGGELQVISSPGKGTTMRILLPCATQGHPEDQPAGAVG